MVDGIYTMTYLGASGDWGMGMLVLRQGIVVGADAVGGLYDGRYIETPDSLNVEMAMTVPAGVTLVQGTPARPTAYQVPFNVTIPKASLEKSTPILVQLPPGPVNLIVKRIRALGT
jgi:hypothetical protein